MTNAAGVPADVVDATRDLLATHPDLRWEPDLVAAAINVSGNLARKAIAAIPPSMELALRHAETIEGTPFDPPLLTRGNNPRVHGANRALVIGMGRAGFGVKAIVNHTGARHAQVREWLEYAGVTPVDLQMRSVDIAPSTLREMYQAQGLSVRDLAARLGISKSVIDARLAKHNVTPRGSSTSERDAGVDEPHLLRHGR